MAETSLILGLLAGLATASMILIAAALVRSAASQELRLWGLAFCVGVILLSLEDFTDPVVEHFGGLASSAMAGALWPFSLLLFGQRSSLAVKLLPLAALLVIFLAGHIVPCLHGPMMFGHRLVIMAIGLAIAVFVLRTEDDDLDPDRRRFRRPFVSLIGAWIASVSILGALATFSLRPESLRYVDEAGTAIIAIFGAIFFTAPRAGLFAAPTRPKANEPAPVEANRVLLQNLDRLMAEERVWLEEGLTVGDLAERLGVPEHRLRPLINQELGYRNFAAFINSHRLDEAKRRLTAPEHARETVASIAYSCGFGSLGPFGRAFKAETGMTPTAFRRNGHTPISKA